MFSCLKLIYTVSITQTRVWYMAWESRPCCSPVARANSGVLLRLVAPGTRHIMSLLNLDPSCVCWHATFPRPPQFTQVRCGYRTPPFPAWNRDDFPIIALGGTDRISDYRYCFLFRRCCSHKENSKSCMFNTHVHTCSPWKIYVLSHPSSPHRRANVNSRRVSPTDRRGYFAAVYQYGTCPARARGESKPPWRE